MEDGFFGVLNYNLTNIMNYLLFYLHCIKQLIDEKTNIFIMSYVFKFHEINFLKIN